MDNDRKYIKFGNRLKMLREANGFKQGQFADKIGITRMSMSNYESGKHCPDVNVLKRMADCLGCSTDYLLGVRETMKNSATFAERLFSLMQERGLSQVQLADALEIKKQSINNYLKGRSRPELDVLMRFADFFECSVDYLLGRDAGLIQTVSDTRLEVLGNLDCALGTITEDEGTYLVEGLKNLVYAVSVSKANPERRNFIQATGKLLHLLAEYIEVSTINEKYLSEHKKQGTLTSEMIAVSAAQMYGFDDIDSITEEIKRTGLRSAISFSVSAKKALRIRTGWRQSRQKGKDNENNTVESSS